jgi:hypothetical protein
VLDVGLLLVRRFLIIKSMSLMTLSKWPMVWTVEAIDARRSECDCCATFLRRLKAATRLGPFSTASVWRKTVLVE